MNLIYSIVLLQFSFYIVNGIVNGLGASPHVTYVNENICQVLSISKIDIFFNRVKLECDWKKFVDAIEYEKHLDPGSYEASQELSQVQHMYDFVFVVKDPIPTEHVYTRVDKNMFRNFRVRSLSLRNLSIKHVDYDTFSAKCCGNSLEEIDLSENRLTRLDSTHLYDLKRLEVLNLARNQLQFGERNFEYNRNLRVLNISGNQLEYLPAQIFYNLNELEVIDLSNNNLNKIDACVFNNIQTNPISRQFSPSKLYLQNNPVECNCDVFYLNRHININLNLTCKLPEVYQGRQFSSLTREDPSTRCQYPKIQKACRAKSNFYELIAIIVLACLTALFLLISVCCLCKNIADTSNLNKLKKELENSNKPKAVRRMPNYVNINTGVLMNSDTDKLLA